MVRQSAACIFFVLLFSFNICPHTFQVRELDHTSNITVSPGGILLSYTVTMTEIQAALLYFEMNTNRDAAISQDEKFIFLSSRSDEIMRGIHLELDSFGLEIQNTMEFEFIPPFGMHYRYQHKFDDLRKGLHLLKFVDSNDVDIPGMDIIQFHGEDGITAGAPSKGWRSAELPFGYGKEGQDAIEKNAGRRAILNRASGMVPAAGPKPAYSGNRATSLQAATVDSAGYSRFKQNIKKALESKLTVFVIFSTLALAFLIGALHALQPGHGKTLVAAYLVGSRGTVWHAVLLGLIVTFTHTFSVMMLGITVLFLSKYILPETVNLWLGIISGGLIAVLGIWLFLHAYKRHILKKAGLSERTENSHAHFGIRHSHFPDVHHRHGHPHTHPHPHALEHEHGHGHGHEKENNQHISIWSLLSLGIVGGLVPCPDAIVILLIAASLQRLAFGLLIITVFSAGVAAVLVIIGILMVSAQQAIKKLERGAVFLSAMPIVSAVLITLIGFVMLGKALLAAGML